MILEALAIVAVCAAANRLAGGGLWIGAWWDAELMAERGREKLWGRAMYVAALAVAAVALLAHPPLVALAWGGAYAFWRSIAHGRWFDLGRLPVGYGREMTAADNPPEQIARGILVLRDTRLPFERAVEAISFGSDHVALFWRHLTILPGLALVAWLSGGAWTLLALAPAFALAAVASYEAGWRLAPSKPITLAELLAGALIGALIALS